MEISEGTLIYVRPLTALSPEKTEGPIFVCARDEGLSYFRYSGEVPVFDEMKSTHTVCRVPSTNLSNNMNNH